MAHLRQRQHLAGLTVILKVPDSCPYPSTKTKYLPGSRTRSMRECVRSGPSSLQSTSAFGVGAVVLADVEDRVEARLDLDGHALAARDVELVHELARVARAARPGVLVLAVRRRPGDDARAERDWRLARSVRLGRRRRRRRRVLRDAAGPGGRDPRAAARRWPSRRARTSRPPRGRAARPPGAPSSCRGRAATRARRAASRRRRGPRRRRSRPPSRTPPARSSVTRAVWPSPSSSLLDRADLREPHRGERVVHGDEPRLERAGRAVPGSMRTRPARRPAQAAVPGRSERAASANDTGFARCRPARGHSTEGAREPARQAKRAWGRARAAAPGRPTSTPGPPGGAAASGATVDGAGGSPADPRGSAAAAATRAARPEPRAPTRRGPARVEPAPRDAPSEAARPPDQAHHGAPQRPARDHPGPEARSPRAPGGRHLRLGGRHLRQAMRWRSRPTPRSPRSMASIRARGAAAPAGAASARSEPEAAC